MIVGLGVIGIFCAVSKMIFLLRKSKDHLINKIADKTSFFDYFLLLTTVLIFLFNDVIQLLLLDILLVVGIANTIVTFYYARKIMKRVR
ncbi:hypothetical protein [Laceyella tengchongensis]|uniref:hypothetical protein n=1 Tax=Laceyella tengchongensis TaxID=574699 RepID=UPI0012B8E9CA|nr:hypothetical protein [Laceyella tengchongensis]